MFLAWLISLKLCGLLSLYLRLLDLVDSPDLLGWGS